MYLTTSDWHHRPAKLNHIVGFFLQAEDTYVHGTDALTSQDCNGGRMYVDSFCSVTSQCHNGDSSLFGSQITVAHKPALKMVHLGKWVWLCGASHIIPREQLAKNLRFIF